MIPITLHDSIKPAGLVRRGVAKFVWIQFGEWAVRASVASPHAVEAERIQSNLATKQGEKTGGLMESCTRLKVSITWLVDFIRNDPDTSCSTSNRSHWPRRSPFEDLSRMFTRFWGMKIFPKSRAFANKFSPAWSHLTITAWTLDVLTIFGRCLSLKDSAGQNCHRLRLVGDLVVFLVTKMKDLCSLHYRKNQTKTNNKKWL